MHPATCQWVITKQILQRATETEAERQKTWFIKRKAFNLRCTRFWLNLPDVHIYVFLPSTYITNHLIKECQYKNIYTIKNLSETFFQQSEQNWEKLYATHLSVNRTSVGHLCVPMVWGWGSLKTIWAWGKVWSWFIYRHVCTAGLDQLEHKCV